MFPALSVANNLRLGAWTRRKDGDAVAKRRQRQPRLVAGVEGHENFAVTVSRPKQQHRQPQRRERDEGPRSEPGTVDAHARWTHEAGVGSGGART